MESDTAGRDGIADDAVSGIVNPPEAITFPTTEEHLRSATVVPLWSDHEPNAAGALRLGRTSAYSLAKRGDIPTIRLGRKVVVPSARLLALLGVEG